MEALLLDLTGERAREAGKEEVERIAALAACHGAVKAGDPLSPEKMNALLRDLFRCDSPYLCPHGRPVLLRFSDPDIEKGFKRR